MDTKAIAQLELIAQRASENAVTGAWWFWVVLVALPALAAWLGAYFRQRGEIAARQADLDKVLSQLKATTEATEQIRLKLGFEDWRAKEVFTAQRHTLELMKGLTSLIVEETINWFKDLNSIPTTEHGFPRANLQRLHDLYSLYFPHLNAHNARFAEALQSLAAAGYAQRSSILDARDDAQKIAAVKRGTELVLEVLRPVLDAQAAFDEAIELEMFKLLNELKSQSSI